MTIEAESYEPDEQELARLVTGSLSTGVAWRDLTPLDIARHLIASGVRIVVRADH